MRKIYTIILAVAVALGTISCNGKGAAETANDSIEQASQGNVTEEYLLELIKAVPDHEIKPGTEQYFTPEYYDMLQKAWAVPSDGIGEIGSDEWLYYFISGNGGWDENYKYHTNSCQQSDSMMILEFSLEQFGESRTHTMMLKLREGRWVIADYDSTYSKMEAYIAQQHEYFQSQEWQNYLAPILAGNDEFSKEAHARQHEVKEWLKGS